MCCGLGTGFDLHYFLVPWAVWRGMKENYGHKYATADELASYEVKADMVIWFLDYLSPETSRKENSPFNLLTI